MGDTCTTVNSCFCGSVFVVQGGELSELQEMSVTSEPFELRGLSFFLMCQINKLVFF